MNRMHKVIPQLDGAELEKVHKSPNYRTEHQGYKMIFCCLWDQCGQNIWGWNEFTEHMKTSHNEVELRCE